MEKSELNQTANGPGNLSFFQKPAGKFGLLGGVAAAALWAIYYVIDDTLMLGMLTSNGPVLVALVFAIIAAFVRKNQLNGFISFGQAFINSFLAFTIALFIYVIFSLFLMFVIDTTLIDKAIEFQDIKAQQMVESGKLKEEMYLKQQEYTTNNQNNVMLFGGVATIFVYAMLGSVVFLISSAIIRNEPPYLRN